MADNGIDLSKITLEYQKKPGVNKSKKLIVSGEEYEQKDEEALRKNVFAKVADENGKWSIDKQESAEILADAKKYAGDDNIFTASEMKEMFTDWGFFERRKDTDSETEEEWFKKGVQDFTNYMATAFDADVTGFDVDKALEEVDFGDSESSTGTAEESQESEQQDSDLIQQHEEAQAKVADLTSQIAEADKQFPLTINENSKILSIITAEDGTKSVKAVKKSGGNSVYGILNTVYGYNSMEREEQNALLTAFMDANPEVFPTADTGMSMKDRLDARKTITVGLELKLPETTAYLQSQELKVEQAKLDELNTQVGLYKDQYEEGDSISRETTDDGTIKETLADADGKTKSVVFYSKDNLPETKYDYERDENGNVTEQYKYDLTSENPDRADAIIHFGYKENDDGTFSVSSQTIEKDIEYDDAGQRLHSVTYAKDGETILGQTDWSQGEDGSVIEAHYAADGTTPVSSVTTLNGVKIAQDDYKDGELATSYKYTYDESGNLSEFSHFDHSNFKNTVQKYSYETGERALSSIAVQQYSDAEKTQIQSETAYAADGKTITGKTDYTTTEYNGQNYNVKTQYSPSPANTVVVTYTDESGNVAYEDTLECFDDPIANADNSVVKKHTAKDYAQGTMVTTEYNADETVKSVQNADIEGNVESTSLYQYKDGNLLFETTLNPLNEVSNEKYYRDGNLSSSKDYMYDPDTNELVRTEMRYADGNLVTAVNYDNGVKISDDFYIYKDGVRSSKITSAYDTNGEKIGEIKYGADDSIIESTSAFTYNGDGSYSKQVDYTDGNKMLVDYNTAEKPVKYVMEDADGNVTYTSVIAYDSNNRKISETKTLRDDAPYEDVAYTYNADGSYSVSTSKYKDGKVSETNVENYDKDGKLLVEVPVEEQGSVTSSYTDYNGDGTSDAIVYYKQDAAGVILSSETDDGMDGTIDSVSYNKYDEEGNLVALEVDANNNGKIDQTYNYAENAAYFDQNEDGVADAALYDKYDDAGVRTSQEIDADNDGKIDAVTYYRYDKQGNLIAIEDDNDNDGKIDNKTEF